MPHSIFNWDYSGTLMDGVFFELIVPLNLPFEYPPPELPWGTVVNDISPPRADCRYVHGTVHFDEHPSHDCPLDASHETSGQPPAADPIGAPHRRDDYWIELVGGGTNVSKFVCDVSGLTIVVSDEFAHEMSQSTLMGITARPLRAPAEWNQTDVRDPNLFFLDLQGRDCLRRPRVVEPTPNRCPFCQWQPVVCPACRQMTWDCPHCKHRIIVPASTHGGPADKRFTIPGAPVNGWVLEGDQWDGSDVIGGVNAGFATGRFIDVAVEHKAAPFVAIPCLVDVSRCDGSQLARLEKARYPHWRQSL